MLSDPIRTNINYLLKMPWISGEICANIKKRQNYYSLLDKIKCPINSTHDLEILSQIKLGK